MIFIRREMLKLEIVVKEMMTNEREREREREREKLSPIRPNFISSKLFPLQ